MIHFIAWGVTFIIWPGEILGAVMLVMMYRFFRAAQRNPNNPIDFGSMFVWPAPGQTREGQTSAIIFLSFCAGMTGIWIVLDQEFKSRLEGTVFLGFLGIMVFGKSATEFVNAWRDRGPPPPPPPAAPNQIIGNAGSVNAAPAPTDTPKQPAAAEASTDVEPRPRNTSKGRR